MILLLQIQPITLLLLVDYYVSLQMVYTQSPVVNGQYSITLYYRSK